MNSGPGQDGGPHPEVPDDTPRPADAPPNPAPAPEDFSHLDFTIAPRATGDRWAHRRGEPRLFAVLWMLYILAANLVTVAPAGVAGMLSLDVYRGAMRQTFMILIIGAWLLWPMMRLSQAAPLRGPVRSVLLDWLVINLPLQAVIWTQCFSFMAGWPVAAGLAMTFAFAGWSLLASGVLCTVYAGEIVAGRTGMRWPYMLVLTVMALAGPLAHVLLAGTIAVGDPSPPPLLLASPLGLVLDLSADRSWTGVAVAAEPGHFVSAALAAVAGGFLLLLAKSRARGWPHTPDGH